MAYTAGDIISAADINGFINVLDTLWGVGYGTRGYGQTSTLNPVQVGDVINGSHWQQLVPRISTISMHQTNSIPSGTPAAIDFNAGKIIEAKSRGTAGSDLSNVVTKLDTDRLQASSTSLGVITGVTSVRFTPWGDIVPKLVHEVQITFPNDNSARHFFNSGGSIEINGRREGGSTNTQNQAWTNLLQNMGAIRMGHSTTTFTGTGVGSVNGYYKLTPTYSRIAAVSGPSYGMYDYAVYAKTNMQNTINGANGNIITIRIEFSNGGVYGSDMVDGTLTSVVKFVKATTYLAITTPHIQNIGDINI